MTKNELARLLGVTAIIITASTHGVLSSIDLNVAYLHMVRALAAGTPSALGGVAEQFSSAVSAQPTARRKWDEMLVWFRLGQYERAAHVLATIDPHDLVMPLKGTQPSAPLWSTYRPTEQDTLDWLRTVAQRPPSEYLVLKGLLHEERGHWAEALQFYRLALVVAPQIYDGSFYRHYYNALAHSHDPLDRSVASSILQLLAPASNISSGALVLASSVLTDTLPYVVSSAGECGRVVSFNYDRDALERGPLVPVRLAWECSSEGKATSGCLHSGRSIVQRILAVNLIPNAGFEWGDVSGRVYPLGHERTIHHYDNLAHRFLTTDERSGRSTHVAALRNVPELNQGSFVPAPIAVVPDTHYLQAAWAKSPGGTGHIGVWWRSAKIITRLGHSFRGVGKRAEWQALARVVQAPNDAHYVDASIGYQNATEADHYSFDDILFVPLPESPCVQTKTVETNSQK